MDNVAYDQRYQQQYPGQPEFWPQSFGYHQDVLPAQDHTTFSPQHGSEHVHNYQYNEATQTPRQMTTNEWMLIVPPHSNPPHTYGPPHSIHHYGQPPLPPPQSVAPGYLPQVHPPIHQGMPYADQRPSTNMDYHSQPPVTYYSHDPQRGMVTYQPHSNVQPAHFPPAAMLHDHSSEHYLDPHSASSTEGGWQMIECNPHRRPNSTYLGHPLGNHSTADQGLLVAPNPVECEPLPSYMHASQKPQPTSRNDSMLVKTESIQSPPSSHGYGQLQSDYKGSHDAPMKDGSQTPSSSTTSDTPRGTPFPVPTKAQQNNLTGTPSKALVKKTLTSLSKKEALTEKRVGKRKGPLKPEQRKQAGEIRKLKACLRCKFLKKTCDTGDPCSGCKPSHARLWQVPCTRIGVQELGFFTSDFTRDTVYDYELENIIGESPTQVGLWISHGFGIAMHVNTRELYVKDIKPFLLTWKEGRRSDQVQSFSAQSATLKPVEGSITEHLMSDYIDRHIDGCFEQFVDKYVQGTKFISEMLRTVYKYHRNTNLPIVRKGLKLVLAYSLTTSITLAEHMPDLAQWGGKVEDSGSRNHGKTVAPSMVNNEVKRALASLWRGLMKEVLTELARLYNSVYGPDKLKNWPTIFMLDTVLLAVWEEMQFDTLYADSENSKRFCQQMEGIPVGVIVGLFLAISTKLPTFLEWDPKKHHHVLNSDPQACQTMSEVREHVIKHEAYLKSRTKECRFDPTDFDSLANKFVSRLVVRAN